MAGNWVKIAQNIDRKPQFWRLCQMLNLSEDAVGFKLYQLADWFHRHGDYGSFEANPSIIDLHVKTPGFADALATVGWLRIHESTMTLSGFCEASAVRKSLGKKIRDAVLAQALCAPCNRSKGRKLPSEWRAHG